LHKAKVRHCISCRKEFDRDRDRDRLVKVTRVYSLEKTLEKVIVNPSKFELGRSAYICKTKECITLAVKEKKIARMLKVSAKSVENIVPELEKYSKLSTQGRINPAPTAQIEVGVTV